MRIIKRFCYNAILLGYRARMARTNITVVVPGNIQADGRSIITLRFRAHVHGSYIEWKL